MFCRESCEGRLCDGPSIINSRSRYRKLRQLSEIFQARAEIQVTLMYGRWYISRVDSNSAPEAM